MIDVNEPDPIKVGKYLAQKMKRTQNKKLGPGVKSFSLPPGRAFSCEDATDLCERLCYVPHYANRYPGATRSYMENFALAKRPDFGEILSIALSLLPSMIFRIHSAGDFFSVDYIAMWDNALKANPQIRPFAFTRAWRDPVKRLEFERRGMHLTPLEGGYILASVDDETGDPPEGWRPALMRTDVLLTRVKKRRVPIPKYLCNEQHPTIGKFNQCRSCGRCPGYKLREVAGQSNFVQLKGAAATSPITFALH